MALKLSKGAREALYSGSFRENFQKKLEEHRRAFEGGEKFALFEVLLWCGILQAVIPEWAVDALIAIKDDVDHGRIADAESFGSTMGPPGRPVARAKATAIRDHSGVVLMMIARLRTEGLALDNNGFEAVKERLLQECGLNLSRKDIEDVYKGSGKDWLKKIPQGEMPQGGLSIGHAVVPYAEMKMRGRPLFKP
ncbi:hypothetical protein [Hydrogenophaga sp. NFH-34]|uniref:hypothetical protein n=1 Tax=Hydrogenophaga sp. NFH-34 TaxID=2744446 RepID=UPI001F35EFE4|nr:hypothetical protein [Hydrogenophaga sp. NFH-34]